MVTDPQGSLKYRAINDRLINSGIHSAFKAKAYTSVGPYVKVMIFLLKIGFLIETIGVESTD